VHVRYEEAARALKDKEKKAKDGGDFQSILLYRTKMTLRICLTEKGRRKDLPENTS
jgi:hypothetical protein